MPISNFPNGFANGVNIRGIPLLSAYPGNVFWVHSGTGSDGNRGTFDRPFATIDGAISSSAVTASRGDIIMVKAGHAETTTSAITMDVAGVAIIGLGVGRSRPAITGTFGSAGDTVTVTAANCAMSNIRLVASGASQNAQVNIAAADFTMSNCVIEQGSSNLIGVTVASGGHRFCFSNCMWLGTANGPDVAIDFESSASDDYVIEDCLFNFGQNGCDLGVIRANADTVEGGLIRRCAMIGVDTVAIDFNSSAGATGDGLVSDCRFVASAALTSIEDIIDVGGYNFAECYAVDAVSASAARVPLSTVS